MGNLADNICKQFETIPRSNVSPDLNSKLCDTDISFLKEFVKRCYFEKKKSAEDNKCMKNYPACKELELIHILNYHRFR